MSRSSDSGEEAVRRDNDHEGGHRGMCWGLGNQEWLPGGGDVGLVLAL